MATLSIDNLGKLGILRDPQPYSLPPEAFTSGGNIRFLDNHVESMLGHSEVFSGASIAPYWAYPVKTPSTLFWVYAGLTGAAVYNGSSHTDITRASGAYNATADRNWNGGLFGGLLTLNNGVDYPQYWASASTGTKLADLTNWPTNYKCKVLIPYRNFLIALYMTEGAYTYPHRILWSHSADPGTIPTSWDIADATKDAGEFDLIGSTPGELVGGAVLGEVLIIYKENSVHAMRLSGDNNIFKFNEIFSNIGMAGARGVVQIPNQRKHFVNIGDDLIIHDGNAVKSALDKRQRRSLLNSVDSSYYLRSFVTVNLNRQEVWFCYPSIGSTFPDKALIYNYDTGAVGNRDLAPFTHIAIGEVAEGSATTWASSTGTWGSTSSLWNSRVSSAAANELLMLDGANTKFFKGDSTNQFDAVNVSSFVEKTGLAIIGKDRFGQPKVDLEHRKIIRRIWLKLEGGPVTVRALMQEELKGSVTYSSSMPFDPATQRYVDLPTPLSGLLMGLRIESEADVNWKLHGYDIDYEVLGAV